MAKRKVAYQRIEHGDEVLADVLESERGYKATMEELAYAQVQATLAVAQGIVELQAGLEGIRATILNLR